MSTNDKPPAPQQGPAPGDAAATVPRDRYDVQAAARYKAEADLAEARRQLAEADLAELPEDLRVQEWPGARP